MLSDMRRRGAGRGRCRERRGGHAGGPGWRLVAAMALLAWGGPAAAAEPEAVPAAETAPERYYGTATVRERPLASATAAVTVLAREEIEASGARSVAELLWRVPGVTVAASSPRGGLTTGQIRGGDPNFTLVLLDGVPLNDPTYQVGDVFNLEGLSLAAVERIEVVRGPLSAFYGSTGLAGAVNIVTRRPGPAAAAVEVESGSASERRVRARGGGERGSAGYLVAASWEEESGRVAAESFELADVYLSLAGSGPEPGWRLGARVADWSADDYPDASGGPRLGSGELRRSDNREASLLFEMEVGSGRADHRLVASVYRHDLDRISPAVFPLVPPAVESTRFTRSRLGWLSSFRSGRGARLSVGVDAQLEEAENRSTLLLPPFLGGAVAGDYRLERLLPGALVEVVVERGAVTWEAGGRLDAPEGAGLQFNPRLGVSRRLAGGRTRVRASAGRAFKLPSTFALASPAALGGNPDLVAESALGGDLGVQHRFGNGVEAELGVFLQRYTDLIDFDFGRFTHLNRSRVETRGVEGALAWRPSGRWSITAALTWQEVENRDTGGGLRQRPEWSGAAAVGWRPLAALRLALDVTGVSDRLDSQIPVPARERVGGYAVAGLTATWRPEGAWSIRARVENLADREHETFIGFPGAGRGARIRVRWRSR